MNVLTVGSLFSGIGGLELGLERAGGFRTIWNCEIDPYSCAVLRKHWAGVPNIGDITKVDWNGVERPNLICGGFPCVDISNAGKKRGIKKGTQSGLWFEYEKAVSILRPEYVLVENVSAIVIRGIAEVKGGLEKIGYSVHPFAIRARILLAPHSRARLFFIAHSNSFKCDYCGNTYPEYEVPYNAEWIATKDFKKGRQWKCWLDEVSEAVDGKISKSDFFGMDDGLPSKLDSSERERIKCLGNAVVPQIARVMGEIILKIEKNRGI